jgi:hypothetical protein
MSNKGYLHKKLGKKLISTSNFTKTTLIHPQVIAIEVYYKVGLSSMTYFSEGESDAKCQCTMYRSPSHDMWRQIITEEEKYDLKSSGLN